MSTSDKLSAGVKPETAQVVEAYFARVHGALLRAKVGECAETVEDLRSHVYEELAHTTGTREDVVAILDELGDPETLAAACADMTVEFPTVGETEPAVHTPLAGRLLGMPYDLRVPTPGRVASRWWDPMNPAIFVPRVFGIGWDVNFGAVAVKLGIVRPDDEDVPFASVPTGALLLAVALPAALAVALGVLIAIYQSGLPAQVPVHWGITGAADRFDSKSAALAIPVIMTLLGLVSVASAWLGRRPALNRVAAGALATLLATISVSAYGQTVLTSLGPGAPSVILAGIALALVLPFVLLVTLSRVGRAAEMRRDLEKKGDLQ